MYFTSTLETIVNDTTDIPYPVNIILIIRTSFNFLQCLIWNIHLIQILMMYFYKNNLIFFK